MEEKSNYQLFIALLLAEESLNVEERAFVQEMDTPFDEWTAAQRKRAQLIVRRTEAHPAMLGDSRQAVIGSNDKEAT